MHKQFCSAFLFYVFCAVQLSPTALAQGTLQLYGPAKHEVIQREYWVPQFDYVNRSSGSVRGFGKVEMKLEAAEADYDRAEVQILQHNGRVLSDWKPIDLQRKDNWLFYRLSVPAGGWYTVKLRLLKERVLIAEGESEEFGVGEVFVVAGQSYATNCNDKLFDVKDPQQRVVCWDHASKAWRTANDPQAVVDGTKDGSIWPLVGDELVRLFDVPVAFVNVAYGGTSSEQWLPGGALHKNLVDACGKLQKFRGVLWQQGESDVIDKRPTEKYVQNLIQIRDSIFAVEKRKPRWWIAKSTLHPTVYMEPKQEHAIRIAYDILVQKHGFEAGPDTDRLGGENRGGPESRRHFSEIGQINAAKLWVMTLYHDLTRNAPEHWAVHADLDGLKLRKYVWSEPIVWNESSILLTSDGKQEATARLAFSADEILDVRAANRSVSFQREKDFSLDAQGGTLFFRNLHGFPTIAESDLFKPAGSPQSYRHRANNPEQNLLYAPGRWFHDRNIEITYKRREESSKMAKGAFAFGQLPKTQKRLVSGEPIRMAISGDSISTGLDASSTTQANPNQLGYPELVAAQIERDFGVPVELSNRSVPGWSVANGVEDLENLFKAQPNLIVIAYGMNDVGRRDPKWFAAKLSEMLQHIKAYSSDCEVIIVSPMLGNPEWIHTPRDMFDLYRQEMKSCAGEGVAFADVTAVWSLFNQQKHFLDMTGNGLNHPNDFGHQIYAQVVLSCLPEPD